VPKTTIGELPRLVELILRKKVAWQNDANGIFGSSRPIGEWTQPKSPSHVVHICPILSSPRLRLSSFSFNERPIACREIFNQKQRMVSSLEFGHLGPPTSAQMMGHIISCRKLRKTAGPYCNGPLAAGARLFQCRTVGPTTLDYSIQTTTAKHVNIFLRRHQLS
jgi:hypothetical protein